MKKVVFYLILATSFSMLNAYASDIWVEPITKMEFVKIEGSCFMMGNNMGKAKEKPVHKVCVDTFWIGMYEVTNEQYRKYMPSREKEVENALKRKGLNENRHPVVYVNWERAKQFADWLTKNSGKNYRLPTEAEWEYAARGGLKGANYWADSPDRACEYGNIADKKIKKIYRHWFVHNCSDGYPYLAPVGSFKPNAYGLYDMIGNVWEWCEDNFDEKAYHYHSQQNPLVLDKNLPFHVIRGGSWVDKDIRFTERLGRALGYDSNGRTIQHTSMNDVIARDGSFSRSLGFRLVREK